MSGNDGNLENRTSSKITSVEQLHYAVQALFMERTRLNLPVEVVSGRVDALIGRYEREMGTKLSILQYLDILDFSALQTMVRSSESEGLADLSRYFIGALPEFI